MAGTRNHRHWYIFSPWMPEMTVRKWNTGILLASKFQPPPNHSLNKRRRKRRALQFLSNILLVHIFISGEGCIHLDTGLLCTFPYCNSGKANSQSVCTFSQHNVYILKSTNKRIQINPHKKQGLLNKNLYIRTNLK